MNIISFIWIEDMEFFNIFYIFWNFASSKVSLQSLDRIQFSNAHFFYFLMRITHLKKNWGPFAILGLFGPYFRFSFFFNFRFFWFFKYLIMSQILATIFIWNATSRPLICAVDGLFMTNHTRDTPVGSYLRYTSLNYLWKFSHI